MRDDKCCKCHYVKTPNDKRGKLRKVRGPWPHCSYDMQNCCKDKKTIESPHKFKPIKRTQKLNKRIKRIKKATIYQIRKN